VKARLAEVPWTRPVPVRDDLLAFYHPNTLAIADRNHPRVGSHLSAGRAQDHCNGFEGFDPQSVQLSA
jgi:hypothetical protein